ncbi:MAG: alkaline shock response membrane anchor protein AmaP [Candidatus Omnitrophica bacterium]|nr:alkaline shock response membrane anchor protein AmaP [Candidatus Omnitrophota bacterium]
MRLLGILFYTAVLVIIGLKMIAVSLAFSFDFLRPQAIMYINNALAFLQNNANARIILGLSGFLLILVSISLAQVILGKFQREKTIAFKTASGEVTIALTAVEDLIRRITYLLPDVKELRPDVRAHKKGLTVDLRVVLSSEANIPGLTERIEEITKTKMQEVLGLEEKVVVNTHIVKIISAQDKDKRKKDDIQPTIPFSGYGKF